VLRSPTDTTNLTQVSGTALKLQADGEQFAVIGTVSTKLFTALSIPGAVGGADPYQFGVGEHPTGAADTGVWSDPFFTALNGARVGADAAIADVLTVYAQNASTNAIRIFKDGPNNTWRVDKDGATFADGAYSSAGADYAEVFLPVDPDDPPLPGETVVLVGDRVRRAMGGDNPEDVIGVVSERPSVIGDMGLLTQGGVAVGLVGKLRVLLGQIVNPRWRRLVAGLYLLGVA
jgi:hypothetical protein